MIGSLRQACCCLFSACFGLTELVFLQITRGIIHGVCIPNFGPPRFYRVGEVPATGLTDLFF